MSSPPHFTSPHLTSALPPSIHPPTHSLTHSPTHAGLRFTNSSRSSRVATPRTNLRSSSVTTAKSWRWPAWSTPSKKASRSSSGVASVMTRYGGPARPRRNRTIAFEIGSEARTRPASSCACSAGIATYPSSDRVAPSTIVRCV